MHNSCQTRIALHLSRLTAQQFGVRVSFSKPTKKQQIVRTMVRASNFSRQYSICRMKGRREDATPAGFPIALPNKNCTASLGLASKRCTEACPNALRYDLFSPLRTEDYSVRCDSMRDCARTKYAASPKQSVYAAACRMGSRLRPASDCNASGFCPGTSRPAIGSTRAAGADHPR